MFTYNQLLCLCLIIHAVKHLCVHQYYKTAKEIFDKTKRQYQKDGPVCQVQGKTFLKHIKHTINAAKETHLLTVG